MKITLLQNFLELKKLKVNSVNLMEIWLKKNKIEKISMIFKTRKLNLGIHKSIMTIKIYISNKNLKILK